MIKKTLKTIPLLFISSAFFINSALATNTTILPYTAPSQGAVLTNFAGNASCYDGRDTISRTMGVQLWINGSMVDAVYSTGNGGGGSKAVNINLNSGDIVSIHTYFRGSTSWCSDGVDTVSLSNQSIDYTENELPPPAPPAGSGALTFATSTGLAVSAMLSGIISDPGFVGVIAFAIGLPLTLFYIIPKIKDLFPKNKRKK